MTNFDYVTRKLDAFEFYEFFSINLWLCEVKLTIFTSLLIKYL